MYEKAEKSKQNGFIIISLMLALFSVLKVIRGANTAIATEGGIWNYISLLYYVTAIIGVSRYRTYKAKAMFIAPVLYGVLAVISSLGILFSNPTIAKLYVFTMVPYFIFVFASFYFFTESSPKAEQIILLAYIICLAINAYTIVGFLLFGRSRAIASDIYYSLCLFPFALQFTKHKVWKMVFIFGQFLITFLSNKRTGFVAICIGLILYFILQLEEVDRKNLLKVAGRIILIAAAIYFMYKVSTYIDGRFGFGIYARLRRLQEDEGSGRGAMYVVLLRKFLSSNWFEILFGHGMNSAGKVVGADYAHNDFLEVLYNYGIFAFVCIIIFYISIIRQAIVMIIRKSPYAAAFAVSVVIGMALSMFSYFLTFYTFVTCIVAFWGYAIKMETKRTEQLDAIKEESQ